MRRPGAMADQFTVTLGDSRPCQKSAASWSPASSWTSPMRGRPCLSLRRRSHVSAPSPAAALALRFDLDTEHLAAD
jgi:hypothetical protein